MGDRYEIRIRCAACNAKNDHWHAPSSGSMSFICGKCKKTNWVDMEFVARIVSKKEEAKRYKINGFGMEVFGKNLS